MLIRMYSKIGKYGIGFRSVYHVCFSKFTFIAVAHVDCRSRITLKSCLAPSSPY